MLNVLYFLNGNNSHTIKWIVKHLWRQFWQIWESENQMAVYITGEAVTLCTAIITLGEVQKKRRKKKYGDIPIGAFVYVWEATGEEKVGYTDGRGNAKHVGIYCGNNVVRDSTRYKDHTGNYVRDGVGTTTLKNFNRVTLFVGLDYQQTATYNSSVEDCMSIIDRIRKELKELEEKLYDIK